MTEEITIQPTAAELGVSVRSIPQGYTASARYGAERNDGKPTVSLAAPLLIFALSFIPYWHGGSLEIIQNVLVRLITHEYFYHMFLPQFAQSMFGSEAMWFFFLILFAFICRRKTTVEYLLVYTCVLVAVAPATLNEYLAIPGAFVAMHLNLPTILYTAAGTAHLLAGLVDQQ